MDKPLLHRQHHASAGARAVHRSRAMARLLCSSSSPEVASTSLRASRRVGHSVPDAMRARRGSAVIFLEHGVRQLTHAEKAKSLLARSPTAFLATQHHDLKHPYGSVVNIALDTKGRPFTFISRLAEHTANLMVSPQSSLLVSEIAGQGDQLATSRLTLVGSMVPLPQGEDEHHYQERFLAVHKGAYYVEFEDFLCFVLEPLRAVRYIGGFGEMSWVDAPAFVAATVDIVANSSQGAVEHMNADHAAAVLTMVRAFAGLPAATSATMLNLDRFGFDVLAEMPDGKRRSRVGFDPPLDGVGAIRERVVALVSEARCKLESQ